MDFKNYWCSQDKVSLSDLAKVANVSYGYLRMIAYGHRTASADLAIILERETNGAVACESVRPDVDWSYIRGTLKKNAA